VSGFFGVLRSDDQEIPPKLLQRVARRLHSRGSTRDTIWTSPGVGTCFSELEAEVAKPATAQPGWLGANWLLGDVRLDALAELIQELEQLDERLTPEMPSGELILRAWRCWGEACLRRLLGDFSFALYDQKEQSLWCVRDFVGARPFFYALGGGNFYFTNTLAAFRSVPGISADLDETFLSEFLLHGYCTDSERTVYTAIRRLPAGCLLRFRNQSIEVRPFLRLPVEEPLLLSQPGEYLEAYREVLSCAVRDRLPKVPTALYLSGGLDSGSVCAVAAKIAAERGQQDNLKAFTISWRPLFADPEPEFASLAAKHLHTEHEILEEQSFQPFEACEGGQHVTPEPSMEAFFCRAQRQYRRIAAHSNVILSGDGGDDVLTGESWPYFRKLWSEGDWQEIARTLGSFALAHGTLPPLRVGLRAKLRGWFGSRNVGTDYPGWLNPEFAKRNQLKEKWQAIGQELARDMEHPIHPKAYAALHQGFWASVLEIEDAGFTQVPLETRAPLLDLRVLRFLLRLPPVPWCVDKELTRRSMQGELPATILRRAKTPMLENPLEACLQTGRWAPSAPDAPALAIHNYVDWERWSATLKTGRGFDGGSNLFPLALVYWLKDIENDVGIE
jgi:asparagine synthase (glutamine-hydrolysing)